MYSWKRLEAVPDYLLNSPWVSQTILQIASGLLQIASGIHKQLLGFCKSLLGFCKSLLGFHKLLLASKCSKQKPAFNEADQVTKV